MSDLESNAGLGKTNMVFAFLELSVSSGGSKINNHANAYVISILEVLWVAIGYVTVRNDLAWESGGQDTYFVLRSEE